jgi:hypothetical protein
MIRLTINGESREVDAASETPESGLLGYGDRRVGKLRHRSLWLAVPPDGPAGYSLPTLVRSDAIFLS